MRSCISKRRSCCFQVTQPSSWLPTRHPSSNLINWTRALLPTPLKPPLASRINQSNTCRRKPLDRILTQNSARYEGNEFFVTALELFKQDDYWSRDIFSFPDGNILCAPKLCFLRNGNRRFRNLRLFICFCALFFNFCFFVWSSCIVLYFNISWSISTISKHEAYSHFSKMQIKTPVFKAP